MKGWASALVLGILIGGCEGNTRTYDQPFIDRAIDVHAKGNPKTRAYVLDRYEPSVVYLPDMVCVGLKLKRGIAGGDSTYCFDKQAQKLVVAYHSGD